MKEKRYAKNKKLDNLKPTNKYNKMKKSFNFVKGRTLFLRNINMFCRWYTMFNQQESNTTRNFTIYGKIRKREESGKNR